MKTIELTEGDYILKDNSAWIQIRGFAIRIYDNGVGVGADIYRNGKEMEDPLAEAYVEEEE